MKKICYNHHEIEQRDCNVVENNWPPRNQGPVKITSSVQRAGEHRNGVELTCINKISKDLRDTTCFYKGQKLVQINQMNAI